MNEEPAPGLNDQAFEDELRRGFRALGAHRGSCPEIEQLAKFLEADLSAQDAAAISAHVAACGICENLLERMKRFEEGSDVVPPAEWDAVQQRILARLPIQGQGSTRGTNWFLSLLRRPALAYALVVLLVYPAWQGLRPRTEARPSPPASVPAPAPFQGGWAQSFDLNEVRSAGAASTRIRLTERDRFFVLSFFVPIRAGRQYSGTILDEAGKTIFRASESISSDGRGNFLLVCDSGLFSAGKHALEIQEIDPRAGQLGRRFEFRFTVSR